MKLLAIILCRKNSKRLKNKHHLKIGKQSLIDYSLNLLNKTNFFHNIIVSSDDREIIKKVEKKYSDFIAVNRQKKLSTDSTESYEVLINIYNWYKKKYSNVDGIFLIQPTSPFRKLSTIKKMILQFKKYKMSKSIISVRKIDDHPNWMFRVQKNKMKHYIKNKSVKMSQYLDKLYIVNGLGYLLVPKDLLKEKTTIPKNSMAHISNSYYENLDIDTKDDLEIGRAYKKYFNL